MYCAEKTGLLLRRLVRKTRVKCAQRSLLSFGCLMHVVDELAAHASTNHTIGKGNAVITWAQSLFPVRATSKSPPPVFLSAQEAMAVGALVAAWPKYSEASESSS